MKILNLGLDNSILDKNSLLAKRAIEYGDLVEKYIVLTPSPKKETVELSIKTKAYGSGGGYKLIQLIKIYNQAEKILRGEKYDVISVQDQYYLGWIGVRLSKKFKVGLEIQVHGFEKYRGLRKLIAGHVLPRADAVRCVSQRLKKQLIGDFGVAEKKITVVPIWIDLKISDFDLREKEIKGKKEGFVFLTVSRLVPVKNIALQIEAIVEVIKKYPRVELWIVGDGPERKRLEIKSRKLKVENNVKFWGWQNDSSRFYKQADAFLLTSNAEGWGIVVIAAANWSLPIIMTDVGCAGELIRNKESGLVVPVGDQKAVKQAMIELIENRELGKKIGEGARQAILKLPTKEQTLALYKESWEKALNL